MAATKSGFSLAFFFVCILSLAVRPSFAQVWTERGPGPTLNGQSEGIPTNPVSGAVNQIAVPPGGDGNTIYVATVNGGIWKTTNGLSATPTWIPLTDFQLPALSMNSLAISPVSPNTIYGGSGSTSSNASDGSPGFGVVKSIDGGTTWTILAGTTFAGRRINSVVPTGLSGDQVVLAATLADRGGLYRSTNGGATFTRISGGSGLPDAGVSSLISDPGNNLIYYAGVPSNFLNSGTPGVYRSDDGGLSWGLANTGLTATGSYRILLSAHNDVSTNVVYAAVISTSGGLANVYRSTDHGLSWTAMGVPSPSAFPGNQGTIHGALVADPSDPNIVFLSGDRQSSPFPNANGCSNFSANVFRGDASLLPANPWQNVVCNGAHGTSPHADSRALAFDPHGSLLHANDGGLYKLVAPSDPASRVWVSLQGDIRPTELHSVAYDPLNHVTFGGTQDTGTPMQTNGFVWTELTQGDGGRVAIDADQLVHPGTSIRYSSFQFLGSFLRSTWNSTNNPVSFTLLGLAINSGPGAGQTLLQFDPNIQFYNPYVLNAVDTTRMLIGTASIYESFDKGDHLANLGFTGAFIRNLAYGGRLGGAAFPDVFYVATTNSLYHRTIVGGPVTVLTTYPGSSPRAVAMDPQNYQKVFVVDSASRVWASFDEGAAWINVTANLPSLSTDIRTVEVFNPADSVLNQVLIVGGMGGVFQMRRPESAGAGWKPVGSGIPHGLVMDVRYTAACDVLSAGMLGRGAWTITGVFRGASTAGCPGAAPASTRTASAVSATPDLSIDATLSLLPLIPPDAIIIR